MNKPLIYADTDLAISCLMTCLYSAGLSKEAEQLFGLMITSPEEVKLAQRVISGLPVNASTEKAKRGALEMLAVASTNKNKTNVLTPLDC